MPRKYLCLAAVGAAAVLLAVSPAARADDVLTINRELFYGKELSAAQHAEIERWRPRDAAWWLDSRRTDHIQDRLDAITDAAYQGRDGEDIRQLLAADTTLFGLETKVESGAASDDAKAFGNNGSEAKETITVVLDAAVRPDLIPLHEPIYRFASDYTSSLPFTSRILYQIFGEGVSAAQIEAETDRLIAFVAEYKEASGEVIVRRTRELHWTHGNASNPLTYAKALEEDKARSRELSQVRAQITEAYLQSLPAHARTNMVNHILDVIKAGGYRLHLLFDGPTARQQRIAALRDWLLSSAP